ncbi:MAG: helix-turn-helix domain-containing protein [Actinomycetota bacterium]
MSEPTPGRCKPDTMKLLADYWVLRIVEEVNASDSGLRFSALQRALGGASPATLSNRLQLLEERDILTRAENGASVTYSLSERGATVLPVIRAISSFAEADS